MRFSSSERFQNLACAFTQAAAKTARSHRDRLNFPSGAFDFVIDHQKIVLRVALNFLLGPFEPSLNRFLGILAARCAAAVRVLPSQAAK